MAVFKFRSYRCGFAFVSIATFLLLPFEAGAQTPAMDGLASVVQSQICPADTARHREPDPKVYCSALKDRPCNWTGNKCFNELASCWRQVDGQNDIIAKYNSFMALCEDTRNGKQRAAPLATKQKSTAVSSLIDISARLREARQKAERADERNGETRKRLDQEAQQALDLYERPAKIKAEQEETAIAEALLKASFPCEVKARSDRGQEFYQFRSYDGSSWQFKVYTIEYSSLPTGVLTAVEEHFRFRFSEMEESVRRDGDAIKLVCKAGQGCVQRTGRSTSDMRSDISYSISICREQAAEDMTVALEILLKSR